MRRKCTHPGGCEKYVVRCIRGCALCMYRDFTDDKSRVKVFTCLLRCSLLIGWVPLGWHGVLVLVPVVEFCMIAEVRFMVHSCLLLIDWLVERNWHQNVCSKVHLILYRDK